jgi:hypothetical protein
MSRHVFGAETGQEITRQMDWGGNNSLQERRRVSEHEPSVASTATDRPSGMSATHGVDRGPGSIRHAICEIPVLTIHLDPVAVNAALPAEHGPISPAVPRVTP